MEIWGRRKKTEIKILLFFSCSYQPFPLFQ